METGKNPDARAIDGRALLNAAMEARKFSYAPYSHFNVGAALLTREGKIFTGCNIENASFTPTVCAERTALFKAVSEGFRHFAAIAIVGGREDSAGGFCPPCGVCRQVLAEFCPPDLPVILGDADSLSVYTLGEILPLTFNRSSLQD